MSPNTRGKYRSIDALTLHLFLLVDIPLGARNRVAPCQYHWLGEEMQIGGSPVAPNLTGACDVEHPTLNGLKPRCQPWSDLWCNNLLLFVIRITWCIPTILTGYSDASFFGFAYITST